MGTRAKGGGRDGMTARGLMGGMLDEIDEGWAKRLRQEFGRRRWVLSWSREEGGPWLARLSGPGHSETIECRGRTRVDAIEKAAKALRRVLPELA